MKTPIKIFALIIALCFSLYAEAQCSMCKAVVESNEHANAGLGEGLNQGILYLMAMPYILLAGLGYFLYKHHKRT